MRAPFLHAVVLLVFAALAVSCTVSTESAITYAPTPVPTPTGPTPTPAPTADVLAGFERNDQGEMLLPRTINGSYKDTFCDFVTVVRLPEQPDCGRLIRPLHSSRTKDIELPVLVFKATGENPASEPLIYLHGGPADGILRDIELAYEFIVEPYIENYDVIVFDQRGTGLAEPDLRCDSPFQWFSANDEDPRTFVPRTASTCAFDLVADDIDLDQFSRQLSADDVMVLARELGYDSFNLHGSSWGGILGYTVMQLHPEWVRAAVLDSPLSPSVDLTGSMPGSFHEAMSAMQANCDRDANCAARHGDIIARYIRVSEQLEEQPLDLVIFDLFRVQLTADELSYLLFAMFYIPEAIAMVPDLLIDLENRHTALIQEMVYLFGWGWGVDFTFLTYMCTDIVPTSTLAQIDAQQIGIAAFDRVDDAPDGRGHSAQSICEKMNVDQPAAPAMREVVPTTPTLVLSGSMDPITPYSSGQQLVAEIPNGTFVGFDDLSHGITFDECGIEIAAAFLADPEGEADTACVENRPPFTFERVGRT